MSRNLFPLSVAATLLAGVAFAEPPRVAVDIAPVHSLVARVMEGVGTPALIVAPGASPHEYSLRPSEAGALQEADVVFWVSANLTPWLDDAIETLAEDASVVELLEADGATELPVRRSALFEAHVHGDGDHDDHAGHDHEGHDDHAEHGQEDHAEHHHYDHAAHDHAAHEEEKYAADDHAGHADHEGHDDHGHGAVDPHAWLSPDNAAVWLNAIAAALSADDPDNAGTYYANAAAGRAELDALKTEINSILQPVRGENFIVFHDAYQYFEQAFDMPAAGAISISDASEPSPSRIAEIRDRVAEQEVRCVLSEPQFAPGIVAAVMDGTEVRTGVLDPLGSDLEAGVTLYPTMLRNLATELAKCL